MDAARSTTRPALRIALGALATLGFRPADAASDPTDFVVQQVCVDAADKPVLGDPVHCPNRRKLRVGEPVPYRRVDAGNWQALYSYPVHGLGGEIRAMAVKVFGGTDTSGSFADLGLRSGYDLLEVGPHYVSGIRTFDNGGGDQIFWRTTDCVRTDGWIFFPPGLAPGQRGEARSTLKITPGPSTACPFMWRIGPDFTTWERPTEPYRYTSGKVLDTIQSMHFAYEDPANPSHDNDSMEKFYFTREYGFSRWEAWETPAGCQKRAAKSGRDPADACRPSAIDICNGPNTSTFYGKTYLRLDCRDSTFYVADTERPLNPLTNAAAPGDVLGRNLLVNGSFFDGADHWALTGFRNDLQHEARTRNSVLHLAADGQGRLAQAFEIPPDMLAPGRRLRWGIGLAPGEHPQGATLVLTLTRAGAPPVTQEHWIAPDGLARPAVFDMAVPAGDGPVEGRFELRTEGAWKGSVDDAFVAVLDAADRP